MIDAGSREVRAAEMTGDRHGDGEIVPGLLAQLPKARRIGVISGHGTNNTRDLYEVSAAWEAALVVPPRRNGKPWKGGPPERPSATRRSAPSGTSGDGCGSVRAAITGEGLAETAMSRLKRLGERLDAHGPPRQVAKVQIRCAVLNTFNAFGMPDTVAEA